MTETLSTGLTAEWCREQADEMKYCQCFIPERNAKTAQALRIAAAVLDDGAVEKLAYALRAVGGLYDPSGARAVLSYLREKGSE